MTLAWSASARADLLAAFVASAGYPETLVRRDYLAWDGRLLQIDVAGFAREPLDMTTATIVGHVVEPTTDHNQAFAAARALACPAAVLALPEVIELWTVQADRAERVDVRPHAEMEPLAAKYREALRPEALLAAKTYGRQLTLFPTDVRLLAQAREGTADALTRLVEQGMAVFLPPELASDQRAARWQVASQAVVTALAALMVRDRYETSGSGVELLTHAQQRFPGFDWLVDTALVTKEQMAMLLQILGEGVNYQGLDPSVVSRVYEHAVVTRAHRLALGIYYTPPELARRIVDHVPFEEIPPEDRRVLDPACGSGTLLLAAHDRLTELTPPTWGPHERHQYVLPRLVGFDRDPFAAQVARLSLLLHAADDNWNVDARDTLESSLSSSESPTVLISNPPWGDERSRAGTRRQRADDFLHWMVENSKQNTFLAVVLPASWLTSDTSAESRDHLRQNADVFEVWRLPERVFGSGSMAPCVVFAQVRTPTRRPWLYRRVRGLKGLPRLVQAGAGDYQALGVEAVGMRPESLVRGPLDDAAEILNSLPNLGEIATVKSGPVPLPPVDERGGLGEFLWLRSAGSLSAYGPVPTELLRRIRYPEEFSRRGPGLAPLLRARKVLASAKQSVDNPWRLKAALDLVGVIPRESAYMVIPKADSDEMLYALLALLGSRVASCWIDTYDTKMAVASDLLHDLPVPRSGSGWVLLAEMGHALHQAAISEPEHLPEVAREADRILETILGLPAEIRSALDRQFADAPAPEGGARYRSQPAQPVSGANELDRYGAVLEVVANKLRLWIPGSTPEDGVLVDPPPPFLGWHCVDGAAFDVVGPPDDLYRARFTFQPSSWASTEDLIRELGARSP